MAPANWVQANEDGFGYPPFDDGQLFVFDDRLYASTVHGLFRMEDLICRRWQKVFAPGQQFIPLSTYLYCGDGTGLWWIEQGKDFNAAANWRQVTSQGVPGGANPWPMTVFKNAICGVLSHDAGGDIFEIRRSVDIGKTVMNWQQVVDDCFGDPANNKGVDFMAVFNGKIYAGTDTLVGIPSVAEPGDGVEIWESASGDAGTWTQVNADGFGTEVVNPNDGKMRNNHVIGAWAVYHPPGAAQEYLYVGTKSHWGAELWRYDGSGQQGWTNLTPPWAGPAPFPALIGGGPGRNEALVPFQGSLYLAEGYPTGNLARFDGSGWFVVEAGPNPFHPQNGGLSSLVVFDDHLYVLTRGVTKGNQVWGYPFNFLVPAFVCSARDLFSWWDWALKRFRDRWKRGAASG